VWVFDSGSILGDGVWEGPRVENHTVLFPERHLQRLFEAMKTLAFQPPGEYEGLCEEADRVYAGLLEYALVRP
jgi:branched-chain amino acid aminotransferase